MRVVAIDRRFTRFVKVILKLPRMSEFFFSIIYLFFMCISHFVVYSKWDCVPGPFQGILI